MTKREKSIKYQSTYLFNSNAIHAFDYTCYVMYGVNFFI